MVVKVGRKDWLSLTIQRIFHHRPLAIPVFHGVEKELTSLQNHAYIPSSIVLPKACVIYFSCALGYGALAVVFTGD